MTDEALAAPVGHTPGPWEYVPSTEHHGPYITTGADGTYGDVADFYTMSKPWNASVGNGGDSKPMHHQPGRADANARLGAAAPDLLEAARAGLLSVEGDVEARQAENEEDGTDDATDPVLAVYIKRRDLIAAAIAKATES